MARQHVEYKISGVDKDSGEEDLTAIKPVADGEPAQAAVFKRPSENLRTRTEIIRDELEDLKYLSDADKAMLLTSTGSITWNGLPTGTFTATNNLVLRPFLAPAASTASRLIIGANTASQITIRTRQNGVIGQPRAYNGANTISFDFTPLADNPILITVDGTPANNFHVRYDSNPTTGTTNAQLIAALQANGTFVALGLEAVIEGSGVPIEVGFPTPPPHVGSNKVIISGPEQATRFMSGASDAEQHIITPAKLVTFFADALNQLVEGDVIAVQYDALVMSPTYGGRRQSLNEAPEAPAALNAGDNLFLVRRFPARVPGALPLCAVVNGVLIFINGRSFIGGETGPLVSAGASYQGSPAAPNSWADGTVVAGPVSFESALDTVIQTLGTKSGGSPGSIKIGFTPSGNIAGDNVKAALEELDSEKAGLALANTFTRNNTITNTIANTAALTATGNGTGAGVFATAGAAAGAVGVEGTGGAGGGPGVLGTGGGTAGVGVRGTGASGSGTGVWAVGGGTGIGLDARGGTLTGLAISATGGSSAGVPGGEGASITGGAGIDTNQNGGWGLRAYGGNPHGSGAGGIGAYVQGGSNATSLWVASQGTGWGADIRGGTTGVGGMGVRAVGGGTNSPGVLAIAGGTGPGVQVTAGSTGIAVEANGRMINVTDPVAAQEAATKNYVDANTVPQNFVINGNMTFWQRGTVALPLTTTRQFLADRFYAFITAGSGTNTTYNQLNVFALGIYYAGISRVAGVDTNLATRSLVYEVDYDGDGGDNNVQCLISSNTTRPLRVQFSHAIGSGLTGSLTFKLVSGTGGRYDTGFAGASVLYTSPNLAGLPVGTYSVTIPINTIPGTAKRLALVWEWTPTAALAVANETFHIKGVMLMVGTPGIVPIPNYAGRTVAGELEACQRFYEKSYDAGDAPNTSTLNGGEVVAVSSLGALTTVRFQTTKRAAPNISYWNLTGGPGVWGHAAGTTGMGTTSIGTKSFIPSKTDAPNAVAVNSSVSGHWAADSEI